MDTPATGPAALALVSDESVHELCAVGEDGTATAAMAQRFADAGVDTVVLLAIGAGDGDHEGPFGTVRATAASLGLP